MITYVGLSSGEQVRRDLWRVTLGARFTLSDWLSPNPAGPLWAPRVDDWRKAVAAGKTEIAAIVSPASLQGSNIRYPYDARAVVDVTVIGGNAGDSIGTVVAAMDTLIDGVAVLRVARASSSDPTARDAELQRAINEAKDDKGGPFDWLDKIGTILVILAIAALVAAAVYAVREIRR